MHATAFTVHRDRYNDLALATPKPKEYVVFYSKSTPLTELQFDPNNILPCPQPHQTRIDWVRQMAAVSLFMVDDWAKLERRATYCYEELGQWCTERYLQIELAHLLHILAEHYSSTALTSSSSQQPQSKAVAASAASNENNELILNSATIDSTMEWMEKDWAGFPHAYCRRVIEYLTLFQTQRDWALSPPTADLVSPKLNTLIQALIEFHQRSVQENNQCSSGGESQSESGVQTNAKTSNAFRQPFCALVFFRRRTAAQLVMEVASQWTGVKEWAKVGVLVGHSPCKDQKTGKGLKARDQQMLLSEFRDGKLNLVFATSVAEEGTFKNTSLCVPPPEDINIIEPFRFGYSALLVGDSI
jgi:hypothetical protein